MLSHAIGFSALNAEEQKDVQACRQAADAVECFPLRKDLLQRLESYSGKSALIAVQCPTSRKNKIASFIDLSAQCFELLKNPVNSVLLVFVRQRFDLFEPVKSKLQNVLKSAWRVEIVQIAKGSRQHDRNKSGFVFVAYHKNNDALKNGVTHTVHVTGKAHAWEKRRLGCNDRYCRHRSKELSAGLGDAPQESTEEIAAEDKDVDLLAAMLEEGDETEEEDEEGKASLAAAAAENLLKEAENGKSGKGQRQVKDYQVEVFPWAQCRAYYEAVLEAFGKKTELFIDFSSSAHPASAYVARSVKKTVLLLHENISAHARGHAKELLVPFWGYAWAVATFV